MNYHQFLELPIELHVQIIRKCYPIPYVRLRRSCRFMDELCERTRKRLGIYGYRKDPTLYLMKQGILLSLPHVYTKYGGGYPRLVIPMTSENIPRIKQSLSGFAFTHVDVNGSAPIPSDLCRIEDFGEAK